MDYRPSFLRENWRWYILSDLCASHAKLTAVKKLKKKWIWKVKSSIDFPIYMCAVDALFCVTHFDPRITPYICNFNLTYIYCYWKFLIETLFECNKQYWQVIQDIFHLKKTRILISEYIFLKVYKILRYLYLRVFPSQFNVWEQFRDQSTVKIFYILLFSYIMLNKAESMLWFS